MNFFLLFIILLVSQIQCQITINECKRDCELDWIDCVHKCQSINNPPECHQACQKIVKGCIKECSKLICFDVCRIDYEQCRINENHSICEKYYYSCQNVCEQQDQMLKDEI